MVRFYLGEIKLFNIDNNFLEYHIRKQSVIDVMQ
jgi:hypothetical protein